MSVFQVKNSKKIFCFPIQMYLKIKIVDLQAQNASQCDAFWACRSAIFRYVWLYKHSGPLEWMWRYSGPLHDESCPPLIYSNTVLMATELENNLSSSFLQPLLVTSLYDDVMYYLTQVSRIKCTANSYFNTINLEKVFYCTLNRQLKLLIVTWSHPRGVLTV